MPRIRIIGEAPFFDPEPEWLSSHYLSLGIIVGIKGRSLVSVDLVNPPCGDVRWKINGKEMKADFASLPELADSQFMTIRMKSRNWLSSNSKEISISAGDLLTRPNQTRSFDEITVKVETESIASSQPPNKMPLLLSMSRCSRQPPSYWPNVLAKFFSFRILVIGKSGAGKSSLINTAFRVQQDEGQTNVLLRVLRNGRTSRDNRL
ncbi:hypothetical protein FIBSPDRAFT_1047838 [Athelia psychrophila]|uniref:G domain-containing protein n=1 Tax=Athelia psychrophila TaxID=1759441 RepID=A0A166EM35_9AGAM|nr:hypothetical protein FIBSPDRAFT_1047838 [Fibularhizoctonia sp. CBS 109695]